MEYILFYKKYLNLLLFVYRKTQNFKTICDLLQENVH